VSGGRENEASGRIAVVSGVEFNIASGFLSSVSGGLQNTASGDNTTSQGGHTVASGGRDNTASGAFSSVSGGRENEASGDFSSVSGGGQLPRRTTSAGQRGHSVMRSQEAFAPRRHSLQGEFAWVAGPCSPTRRGRPTGVVPTVCAG
jgi:hypothetical protein